MKLSEKIVYMRKKRNISQNRLAKKMNVSRQAVYKWEAGLNSPELEKIYRLAEIFDISYDLLLDEKIDLKEYFENEDKDMEAKEAPQACTKESKEEQGNKKILLPVLISVVAVILIALITASVILIVRKSKDLTDTSTAISDSVNSNTDTSPDTTTDSSEDTSDSNIDISTDSSCDSSKDTSESTNSENASGTMLTITLISGGGTIYENKQLDKEIGKPIGELPEIYITGHVFKGWYLSSDTELLNPITKDTVVTAEMTELVPIHEIDTNEPPVIVVFDANGGNISKNEMQRFVVIGKRLGALPSVKRDGYVFVGWYLSSDTYLFNKYTQTTKINGDIYEVITLKAVWMTQCTTGENHFWDNWISVEEASCVVPQKQAHTCVECGITDYGYVPNSFAPHKLERKTLQEASCEKGEIIEEKCSVCGYSEQMEQEALGHNYKNGVCQDCFEDEYTKGVIYKIKGSSAYVSGYEGTSSKVKISPSYTPEGSQTAYPVTEIKAFSSDIITELVIPEGIKSIGKAFDEFWSLPNLEAVHLPTTLDIVSVHAFKNSKISKVYIKSIEDFCEIESPSEELSANEYTFKFYTFYDLYLNSELLTELHLNVEIDSVSTFIFAYCRSIKRLTMEESQTRVINKGAFYSSGLQYVQIVCNGIEAMAFSMCRDLVSVDLMNTYGPSIHSSAFGLCYRIFEIYVPASWKLNSGDTKYGEIAKFAKVIHVSSSEASMIFKTDDGYFIGCANGSYYLLMYHGEANILKLPRSINGQAYTIGRYFILPKCGYENTIDKIYIPKEIKAVEVSGLQISSNLEIYLETEGKPDSWDTIFGVNTMVYYLQKFDY